MTASETPSFGDWSVSIQRASSVSSGMGVVEKSILLGFQSAVAARLPIELLAVLAAQRVGNELRADVLVQRGWGASMAKRTFRLLLDAYPNLRGYTLDTLALLTRRQLSEEFGILGPMIASALVDSEQNPVFAALLRGQTGTCALSFVRTPVVLDLTDVEMTSLPDSRRELLDKYDYAGLQRKVEQAPPLSSDAAAEYYYGATGSTLTTHADLDD